MKIKENLSLIKSRIPESVVLVAVSKTKSNKLIMEAYNSGHRVFGENKVQEMVLKWETLPKDIEWHMIGHLQTNKAKYIAPFVSLIHGVDSSKLLIEINKRAKKSDRIQPVLLQLHIADEESKFGLSYEEANELLALSKTEELSHITIKGFMGMSTNTEDQSQVEKEFKGLNDFYKSKKLEYPEIEILSMGMSGDYELAIANGSNMVRIGSTLFGARNY